MKKVLVLVGLGILVCASVFAEGKQEAAAAGERPIWIWWNASGEDGFYPDDQLSLANTWAEDNFGITVRMSGPPSGVERLQALMLLIAEGKFPDVMGLKLPLEDRPVRLAIQTLAQAGRLLPLDKYFDDPERYPNLATIGREYMDAYRFAGGKIYASPGDNTRLSPDDWVETYLLWGIQRRVYEKYGAPSSSAELIELWSALKKDPTFVDLDGQPGWPVSVDTRFDEAYGGFRALDATIYMTKGAGWEVAAVGGAKTLLPKWASEETYESLKFWNVVYREGYMPPYAFMIDTDRWYEDVMAGKYATFPGIAQGGGVGHSSRVAAARVKEFGKDDPKTKEAIAIQMYRFAAPIVERGGKIGRCTAGHGTPILVSAECPNPDGVMALINWGFSDEFFGSTNRGLGEYGVDWVLDETQDWGFRFLVDPQERAGWYELMGNLNDGTKPKWLPLYGFARHNEGSRPWEIYGWAFETGMAQTGLDGYMENIGLLGKAHAERAGVDPSYTYIIAPPPSAEVSAETAAEQVWMQSLVEVWTADSPAAFEAAYRAMLQKMIGGADWKSIYTAKQQRWLNDLNTRGYDDRPDLRTVTPRPEWKQVMGW